MSLYDPRGVLNKFLYGEAPPRRPTPYPFSIYRFFANNNNKKLYLQDPTSTFSITKAIYNYVLRIRTKI